MGEGGHGNVPIKTVLNELVLDKKGHTEFLFSLQTFFFFYLFVPISLSHHCYFTSRAMGAAEVGPSKLKLRQIRIYTHNYSFFRGLYSARQESLEQINTETVGVFFHSTRKKLLSMTVAVI